MEHEFWSERWQEGRIAFHQPSGHPRLSDLVAHLEPGRALVPLAGKSVDVATLHGRGHDVVAVEFVEAAVRAFADEQAHLGLSPHAGPLGLELRGERLRFLAADFFRVDAALVGKFDLIYDRAALVALPPDRQPAYVDHLRRLLAEDGQVLTFTFEYDERHLSGPPFSVPREAVERLYAGARIEPIETVEVIDRAPHLAERGLTSMIERSFLISGAAQ